MHPTRGPAAVCPDCSTTFGAVTKIVDTWREYGHTANQQTIFLFAKIDLRNGAH
jgi:hypothetical protein